MPSILNSDDGVVSGTSGLKTTGGNDGILSIQNNGTTNVTVTAAGSVGIGTTSPSAKLNVVTSGGKSTIAIGDTAASTYSQLLMYGGSGKYNWSVGAQYNVDNAFEITPSTATGGTTFSTPSFVINSSGNVGIGTTSPATKLDVNGPASVTSFTGSTKLGVTVRGSTAATDYSGIDFIGNSQTVPVARIAVLTTGGGSSLSFGTSNNYGTGITNTAMIIDGSGRLLVNNTGNTNGYISVTQGTYYGLQSNTTSNGAGIGHVVFTFNNTTTCGTITTSSGNSTAYNTSSDYRLKEDVQPMTGALARVAALKPCTYKWKSAPDKVGEGFIAHELAEVCPQAVTGEKDAVNEDGSIKPQGIDTSFLVATLTAAIQELKAELDATKAEVAALKARTT